MSENENLAIKMLDILHGISLANDDRFERGVVVQNGRVIGIYNDKNETGVTTPIPQRPRKNYDVVITGHTHEVDVPENEFPSDDDYFLRFQIRYGDQVLVRTPTGAIRSIIRKAGGGYIPETLRGPPVDGYPFRE